MVPVKIGKLQTPYLIRGLDASFDVLLALLLGTEINASQSVSIVNRLSGKALEVEDSSTNRGARIQQVTRNDAPNQRWFVKCTEFISHRAIPRVMGRQAHRYWPTFLRFPQPGYSVIADQSGLCLDILNYPTDNTVAVQQFPVNGGRSHLWAFVPDHKGFNFVVNLHSGQVLDVVDNSLKNYAAVQQYPFNGGDSRRWQLFKKQSPEESHALVL